MGASPVLKVPSPGGARLKVVRRKPKLGLRAWMERVLEECDRAAAGFDADAVHDLRVSLRRCRSLADGLMAIDPDPSWKEMKKAGKKLFQALGELRDMQVMEEWIEKLGDHDTGTDSSGDLASADHPSGDAVTSKLLDHVHAREAACKQLAFRDLEQFDRRQWRKWSHALPRRGARVRPGSLVYLHLALEKWTTAYDLHKHALRTRSRVGLHQLRIGIKRFRYTVENFLPRQHAAWGSDLKELQDLLGEVHDLDVLWATAVEIGAFPDLESRTRWRARLNLERERRAARYHAMMVGQSSLWRIWRAQFPQGPQLRIAAMSRMRVWAGYLDPDFAHSERVARLSLLLYDGLHSAGLLPAHNSSAQLSASDHRLLLPSDTADKSHNHPGHRGTQGTASLARPRLMPNASGGVDDLRAVLQAAALMHDVGKARGAHQKASYRMIRRMTLPLGWSARELELAAVVARYHRGALPRPRARALQVLELPDRQVATELAGILRLANALDLRDGSEPALEVHPQNGFVIVRAAGYSALDEAAEEIAGARHLLETVLRRPVVVRGLRLARGKPVGRSTEV